MCEYLFTFPHKKTNQRHQFIVWPMLRRQHWLNYHFLKQIFALKFASPFVSDMGTKSAQMSKDSYQYLICLSWIKSQTLLKMQFFVKLPFNTSYVGFQLRRERQSRPFQILGTATMSKVRTKSDYTSGPLSPSEFPSLQNSFTSPLQE